MNKIGLDYNTTREKLVLPEYGREIQQMVDYCVELEDRKEPALCRVYHQDHGSHVSGKQRLGKP